MATTLDFPHPASSLLEEKYFNHQTREKALYDFWEARGVFKLDKNKTDAPVFSIAMPPPNANGELHLGHAFGYTIKDVLGRFRRLLGERVILIPGKDHAGIQAQIVFEKVLKQNNISSSSLSREELYERCYAFCMDRAAYMRRQEKRLGVSADWSSELFTLDPRLTAIINRTFTSLWNDGLVYKGSRIVNWSILSQTAISDVEVEYREQEGSLWTVLYEMVEPLSSGPTLSVDDKDIIIGVQGIAISTTRPETILGDTALAVHPDDTRYHHLIGMKVKVPLANREIPIVSDARVDLKYGTGVVKVTPAHDFLDYDIGVDHSLTIIQVIGKDGRMTSETPLEFQGLSTQEARQLILDKLSASTQLLATKKITHKVPIGERGKDIIEPLISEQWFIAVDKPGNSLKEKALSLINSEKMEVAPERFRVLFEQWLTQLRDWNISRQLWWGQRIPVWYGPKGEVVVSVTQPDGEGWTPETDVFDTWFSSGQWAFSTVEALGLADPSKAPSEYFPTHTMVMGRDILFFWACRMLLLTGYVANNPPWKSILFTGLIRDEHGQKMSKSKGNGIDPISAIDQHGADALRLALMMGATSGNDLSFSTKKIEGYGKFTNKVWNAAKLILLKGGDNEVLSPSSLKLSSSQWLMSTLIDLRKHVAQKLKESELSIAITELYNFTWGVFCDQYLEIFKILVDNSDKFSGDPDEVKAEALSVTRHGFSIILTMLHPFMPYVTEELYQRLPFPKQSPTLSEGRWFESLPFEVNDSASSQAVSEMETLFSAVAAVRSVKAVYPSSSEKMKVVISRGITTDEQLILFSELAKVTVVSDLACSESSQLSKTFSGGAVLCHVSDKGVYRARLEKDMSMYKATIETITKKLQGDFVNFAKLEVIEKERLKLGEAQASLTVLEQEFAVYV